MTRRLNRGASDIQRPRINRAISRESNVSSGNGKRKGDFMKEVGLLSRRAFRLSSG